MDDDFVDVLARFTGFQTQNWQREAMRNMMVHDASSAPGFDMTAYREALRQMFVGGKGLVRLTIGRPARPRPPHFKKESDMDFQEALDSIRPAEPDEWESTARYGGTLGEMARGESRSQRDRTLVAAVQENATHMLNKKREQGGDRYEVMVWLVTLEVWDAMLRNAGFSGKTPELRWEAIPIVPTNLDLPVGIALATIDDVNAAAARLTERR